MNALEHYIWEQNLDEIEVMNQLQEEGGVISDLCVMAQDVGNCGEAIEFLKRDKPRCQIPNLILR